MVTSVNDYDTNKGLMNPLKNTSPKDLRGRLLLKGLTVSGFAKAHGYIPNTVQIVIHRYCGRQKEPTGIKTASILKKLYCEIQEGNNHEC